MVLAFLTSTNIVFQSLQEKVEAKITALKN